MAAKSTLKSNTMAFSYKAGVDSKGREIIRNQKVKNLSVDATDDAIAILSGKVEALLVAPVTELRKEQVYVITKGIV